MGAKNHPYWYPNLLFLNLDLTDSFLWLCFCFVEFGQPFWTKNNLTCNPVNQKSFEMQLFPKTLSFPYLRITTLQVLKLRYWRRLWAGLFGLVGSIFLHPKYENNWQLNTLQGPGGLARFQDQIILYFNHQQMIWNGGHGFFREGQCYYNNNSTVPQTTHTLWNISL